MQKQAGNEDQDEIADCGRQSGDSKIGTRETQTGNFFVVMKVGIRWWWSLVILGAGLLMIASFYGDASVQAWIADHQDAGTRKFMRGVGQFGDWPGHVTLGLVLLVLAFWRRSKKWMRIFAAMILACALAGAGARVVKIAVGRPRPAQGGWRREAPWPGKRKRARHKTRAASTSDVANRSRAWTGPTNPRSIRILPRMPR